MTQEFKERIFDCSFTAKAVGKLTRLGLMLAKSSTIGERGSSIHLSSTPGPETKTFFTC